MVKEISRAVAEGTKLGDALKAYGVSSLLFFKYLDENPEDRLIFERARQIACEMAIDELTGSFANIDDRLQLETLKAEIALKTWLIEKLIPKTYGTKIEHNVTQTINIKGILEEANKRIPISSVVVDVAVKKLSAPVEKPAKNDVSDDDLTDEEKNLL